MQQREEEGEKKGGNKTGRQKKQTNQNTPRAHSMNTNISTRASFLFHLTLLIPLACAHLTGSWWNWCSCIEPEKDSKMTPHSWLAPVSSGNTHTHTWHLKLFIFSSHLLSTLMTCFSIGETKADTHSCVSQTTNASKMGNMWLLWIRNKLWLSWATRS